MYNGAFANCPNLTSVTLPDSLVSIADYAFGFQSGTGGFVPLPNFTIYGSAGSAAEAYANKYGFAFSTAIPTPTPPPSQPAASEPEASAPAASEESVVPTPATSADADQNKQSKNSQDSDMLLILLAIGGGTILLIIVGVVIFLIVRNKNDRTKPAIQPDALPNKTDSNGSKTTEQYPEIYCPMCGTKNTGRYCSLCGHLLR